MRSFPSRPRIQSDFRHYRNAAIVHGLVDGKHQGQALDGIGIRGENLVRFNLASDSVDERLIAFIVTLALPVMVMLGSVMV